MSKLTHWKNEGFNEPTTVLTEELLEELQYDINEEEVEFYHFRLMLSSDSKVQLSENQLKELIIEGGEDRVDEFYLLDDFTESEIRYYIVEGTIPCL